MFHVSQLEHLRVNPESIQRETRKQYFILKVFFCNIIYGKGINLQSKETKPYLTRHSELPVYQNYLLWGVQAIIWSSLRGRVMNQLNHVSLALFKMKTLPRSNPQQPGIYCDMCRISRIKASTCTTAALFAKCITHSIQTFDGSQEMFKMVQECVGKHL